MLRLISHIKYLLTIHDCVVVPQIGGFVLQTNSAGYDKEKHSFSPLHTEILFNPSLKHNDGLLASSYMKTYQVDFRKAQLMIEEDVNGIKTSLSKYRKVDLGSLGSFSLGESGQMIFSSSASDAFEANNYGLAPFFFPVLPAIISVDKKMVPSNRPQRKADVYYLPISRRLIKTAIASAAAIALFLLLSTPVKEVSPSTFTASFIPTTEIIKAPVHNTEVNLHETAKTESDNTYEVATSESTATEEAAPEVTQPAVATKKYYIIIGSFPNESLANQFIAGVDSKVFQKVGIVERNEKHRVYAHVYDSRKEAEAQLEAVRQINKYETAWLYITR